MNETTETIHAGDGTALFVRSWEPETPVRAAVVLVHGLGEHSGRYGHVGAAFAAAGLAVTAPDLRGFGESGGRRAYVRDMGAYLDDLDPLVARAGEAGAPVVLLGHSMGGLIALRYAQTRNRPDLLVLSAPSVEAVISAPKRLAARILRRVWPTLSLPNDISGDDLSHDAAVGEAYFADPLVHTATTAALGGAMLEAMGLAQAGGIPMPALLIHGGQDPLVPLSATARYEGAPEVERVVFPGFRHESFNEEGGAEAIGTIVGWIERHTPPARSTA
ncbi:MAG: lysophospholipase [Actinobacteria bacterium]|nr:lysophospholipase [Actinomycetota bacterium]